jgi:hypothetical protein
MWGSVLRVLAFGCRHRHLSKPFAAGYTSRSRSSSDEWETVPQDDSAGHYVVCLDCGKHFGYDWSRMQVLK